jgi:uncharacterized protein YecT (DUF1311 family)
MTRTFLLIFSISVSNLIFGQWDPIKEYHSRQFPCDSALTTLEITFCFGYRNDFADSLLNKMYTKVLTEADKDIADSKKDIRSIQLKKRKTKEDSTELSRLKIQLDRNIRYKSSIITSQRIWLKSREANVEMNSILYEDGREYPAWRTKFDTDEILERIEKLKKLCFTCDYKDATSR